MTIEFPKDSGGCFAVTTVGPFRTYGPDEAGSETCKIAADCNWGEIRVWMTRQEISEMSRRFSEADAAVHA